ncbi:CRTAC1 family protein [Tuwongella immobilis]|uniref:ASPIC/UnbV domain-containing protein n=1 Tax=Tuwongella immobilis TaxID=692036 RepID=A0A6C2YJT3_9BACT|nr:CRTAC1 family protein [Tuwongella immobilis]VIP01838.1 ASPIC/UnbV domain protein OS=Syntrophobacter fumaroxidans (strain DSM 10017 / MPOB) GN=Sfum_1617 PE=4 SV=1: VCBS: VCBS: VCBS: UnbV_ASPIC [Tuwongella immobilis]VTR99602.1 ASPIC/UnbV domain protein OS=Syntrophobacter fumaroxidans (strain DSM 10017 / MPOB) GN=Sfum_1617 PE=4 SV=1: VCBS: VCBS: VCBS: UnbV_ASPIC [Tuwongella immobilis]
MKADSRQIRHPLPRIGWYPSWSQARSFWCMLLACATMPLSLACQQSTAPASNGAADGEAPRIVSSDAPPFPPDWNQPRDASSVTLPPSVNELGAPWFHDVTAALGIDWTHSTSSPIDEYFMPDIMGSGVAVFDANGDGRLDILALTNGGPTASAKHALWMQQPNGQFRRLDNCGLDIAGHGMGVACGDFDNDGDVDVYLAQYAGGRLFRNRGDGHFDDVTDSASVKNPRWGVSATFVDFDRDGWLDLLVAHYVDYDPSHRCISGSGLADFCHPNQFKGTASRLYRNRGVKDGTWQGYQDVTAESGLAAKPSNGLGAVATDADGDGWPDLLIANDAQANHLWINQKDGTFREDAVSRGIAFNGAGNPQANMGIAWADLDRDGRMDCFITHLAEELHTLWKQDRPGRFRDATATMGLGTPVFRGTGFGTVANDFDADGWPDLVVVNGRVMRRRDRSQMSAKDPLFDYREMNQVFAGSSKGFRDRTPAEGGLCGFPRIDRGLAWGDIDGDGQTDLVINSLQGKLRVMRNQAPLGEHTGLRVRASDPRYRRDAINARITLIAGEQRWIGEILPGQSYGSSGEPVASFGLGTLARVDSIQVQWPDGFVESFAAVDLAPGQILTIRLERGRGKGVQ